MSLRRIVRIGLGWWIAALGAFSCSEAQPLPNLLDGDAAAATTASSGAAGSNAIDVLATGGEAGVAGQGPADGAGGAGGAATALGAAGGAPSGPGSGCDEMGDDGECASTELCYDGRDNDGDGLADCEDGDCEQACGASCDQVIDVEPGTRLSGDTRGHARELGASCSPGSGQSGPEVMFRVTASVTGKLEATLSTSKLLNVSLRTSCSDDASELACHPRVASIDAVEGEVFYVLVDGFEENDAGDFELDIVSRLANVCGDGHRDEAEGCDDENDEPGDGCSDSCEVEATETEPNDSTAQADPASEPFYAEIAPLGDVDVIAVTLESDASLVAATLNFGDGACALGLLDSYVEILDADGSTVLASDDDSGEGLCARAVASDLAAGTYYVRVTASPLAEEGSDTFPYRLSLSLQ